MFKKKKRQYTYVISLTGMLYPANLMSNTETPLASTHARIAGLWACGTRGGGALSAMRALFLGECLCPRSPHGETLTPVRWIWRWGLREVPRSWGWRPLAWDPAHSGVPREFACPLGHVRIQKTNQEAGPTRPRICRTLIPASQPAELWEINVSCLHATQSGVCCYSGPRGWGRRRPDLVLTRSVLSAELRSTEKPGQGREGK